ncbi:MAG TPA: 6-phosphogluconolactonase [Bacteroidales bacterium]|nr:6-phosphogluconolactonase [Bacteroidales bacterium]
MKKSVNIFKSPEELATELAKDLIRRIRASSSREKPYSIALSGGSTPELLFSFLGDEYSGMVPWEFVHFFWGDERCVPPDHPDSNYGMAKRILFDKIVIPQTNIHRIAGEGLALDAAEKYSLELKNFLPGRDNYPLFDFILLGIGEDGHTASIFTGQEELIESVRSCEVAVHPVTGQKRITLTGRVINNAEAVAFIATGQKKAPVIAEILNYSEGSEKYPASHISPVYGSLDWYLDEDAARLIG